MTKETEGLENKDFDEAFDTAVTDTHPDKEDMKEDMKPDEPEAPPAPEGKKEEPAPPPPETIDDAPYEQKWKTLQGIYRHEKDEWTVEKERLLSELEAAKTAERQPEAKKEDPDVKELLASLDLTDEQKAQLAEYDEEFDVVSKMEGLKRKSEMARLKLEFREMLDGFRKEYAAQQQPVQEFIDETQKRREEDEVKDHFHIIENAHPDFKEYRDAGQIKAWIEKKPGYLRSKLQEVYSTGSAEDIVEMLDDFKRENGITVTNPENVISMNRAKEARKQAMTPPVTKRGAVNASMSVATDFDGAYDEAINKLN